MCPTSKGSNIGQFSSREDNRGLKTEADVGRELDRRLQAHDHLRLRKREFRYLEEKRWVGEILEAYPDPDEQEELVNDCVSEVLTLRESWSSNLTPIQIRADEKCREESTTAALMVLVSGRSDVRLFRHLVLGDRKLTNVERVALANADSSFLLSDSPITLSGHNISARQVRSILNKLGWGPVLGDVSAWLLLESDLAGWVPRALLQQHGVEVFQIRHCQDVGVEVKHDGPRDVHSIRALFQKPGNTAETFRVGTSCQKSKDGTRPLWYPGANGYPEVKTCYAGSVLSWLAVISQKLVDKYDISAPSAAWFILTGTMPKRPAISATTADYYRDEFSHGMVTIKAYPWVSADTVARTYEKARKSFYGGSLRGRSPIGERRCRLLQFVYEHLQPDWSLPPWRDLMAGWNQEYKKWAYKDVGTFRKDWLRARDLLLYE